MIFGPVCLNTVKNKSLNGRMDGLIDSKNVTISRSINNMVKGLLRILQVRRQLHKWRIYRLSVSNMLSKIDLIWTKQGSFRSYNQIDLLLHNRLAEERRAKTESRSP